MTRSPKRRGCGTSGKVSERHTRHHHEGRLQGELMLTPLDDSLWHQIASPFENVGTSDHRFFDRMWFAVYDPAGSGALQFTIGVYNNMNVIDGGLVVIRDTTQYNLRTSRSLR